MHVVKDDGLAVIELARGGRSQRTVRAEGLKKAEPIAKAAEPVKAAEKPASKQVDLDETAVKVRKSNGYRFGADYTNICFGA